MENPFNALTSLSVNRPKATIATILILTMALSSMAQFINFDNSEDAFYPQNDTTELLYEIEDRYQASLDFIRIIDEIEQGGMNQTTTWEQFANLEARILLPLPHTKDTYVVHGELDAVLEGRPRLGGVREIMGDRGRSW